MYRAVGLNDRGHVVDMATFTGGASYDEPALWTGNTITDLNSLLPANSGWFLQTVTAIDQLGDIEGTGLFYWCIHAFPSDNPRTKPLCITAASYRLSSPPNTQILLNSHG